MYYNIKSIHKHMNSQIYRHTSIAHLIRYKKYVQKSFRMYCKCDVRKLICNHTWTKKIFANYFFFFFTMSSIKQR